MKYSVSKLRVNTRRLFVLLLALVLSVVLWGFTDRQQSGIVHAADNNFVDGITVDSTGDGSDANTADSICDDGSGNCTLRAAIQESNQETGTQTIKFNITGTADFTNDGQDGYTIQPTSALPELTDTVIIDGYTQPGSQANTAVAPNPLNGILLIELDGSTAGYTYNYNGLAVAADDVEIRGLVVNNWSYSGIGVGEGDNVIIRGNYIGVDPTGSSAKANRNNGIDCWGGVAQYGYIGGTNPADRNLISGNSDPAFPQAGGIGLGPDHDYWTIQGNYIGVAADGVTAIPNAQPNGAGSPSVDYTVGTVIGGSEIGATNVISGNNGSAISPDYSSDLTIVGNYMGTDYTGTIAVPNALTGITITNGDNCLIEGNIISGNTRDGIFVQSFDNVSITGNKIGTGSAGTEVLGNGQAGIAIENATSISVGGNGVGEGNDIVNNTQSGVHVYNGSEVTILGNTVNNNSQSGISVQDSIATIGGSGAGDENTISDNTQFGVSVTSNSEATIIGNGINTNGIDGVYFDDSSGLVGGSGANDGNIISDNSQRGVSINGSSLVSIIGNFIVDNTNLGIDLNDLGVTGNDVADSDTGPNDLLNFPEITGITEHLGDSTISFDLDVPAGDYRIEFFANTSVDGSGYGEGETYVGSVDITSSGIGLESFSASLTGVSGLANVSSTTTQRNTISSSTFGATSEFSLTFTEEPEVIPATGDLGVTKTLINPEDVSTNATLTYQLTVTNHGPEPIDLAIFTGANPGLDNLIVDIMSPDITYAGNVNDANMGCFSAGSGSAVMFGAAMANHSDYELVFCSWIGPSHTLNVDESYSFSFDVSVQPDSDLIFSNYALLSAMPANDPDISTLSAIYGTGNDVIDELLSDGTVNNFAYAQYPVPQESVIDNAQSSRDSLLAKTGDIINNWWPIGLITAAGVVRFIVRRRTIHYAARS